MKINAFVISITILVMSSFLVNGCKADGNKTEYLKKVLTNLEQIKSASYYTTHNGKSPWDTCYTNNSKRYYKEYNNPNDSTIGASFVGFPKEDTTKMSFCYDGKMRAIVYDEGKTIVIDSFNVRKLPFRPITPPFFNYTKSILKYALETKDSILTDFQDFADSLVFSLTILEDRQVEFFGKAFYMGKTPYNFDETTSKYTIWINKSTDLPYRVLREMSHDVCSITVSDVKLNALKIKDFKASDYFMPDYAVALYGIGRNKEKGSDLIGKVAPNWVLKDANDHPVALADFKGKVLLVQFTSVNCGPCRVSIPFLKRLAADYRVKGLDFVAIESWTKNSGVLKGYQKQNNFDYKFLMSAKEVTQSYHVQAVPVFFILDKDRVVRQVLTGYGEGTTDKEILNAIDGLL
jgi:thiol-disulfide isomerase/thioredoxin